MKPVVIDFTQGAKVAGLSACPDFVTNGEHAHSPFTKNVPNWLSCRINMPIETAMRYVHWLTAHIAKCDANTNQS